MPNIEDASAGAFEADVYQFQMLGGFVQEDRIDQLTIYCSRVNNRIEKLVD
jgi:hypothetical protein